MWKKFLKSLYEIHEGAGGGLSWIRCISTVVIFIVLINYSARTIFRDSTDFGTNEVFVIAGCLGFKVAQRWKEKDAEPSDAETEAKKLKEAENRP